MDYFQMIMALVGVLALVFVIFWVMKRFNARVTLTDSRHLKVLERVNLGPDKMLLIVSVCGKCMLLGVTSQSTEKICDLDETEEELCAKKADGGTFPTVSESLKMVFGKKKNDKKPPESDFSKTLSEKTNLEKSSADGDNETKNQ